MERTYVGTHVIAEFFGCRNLDDVALVAQAMRQAAAACGATVLHEKFHKFSPQGLTGYLLLAESHLSIHTWPEHGYAAIDVFTCGQMRTELAIRELERYLQPAEVRILTLHRGGPELKVENDRTEVVPVLA